MFTQAAKWSYMTGGAQHLPIVKSGKPFDIVFQLQLNEWQGNETVQMQVLDVKEIQ